jgi:glutamate racemase
MKLGILDWGIGGVGLLKKVREKSSADILYFSDTGFTPYGKVETEELKQRVLKVIDYLKENGCTHIAVACNAASTVIPVHETDFGVILPAVSCVKKLQIKRVGIAGGKRTIESEMYKTLLEKEGIYVKQQIAQPLSARIEAGDLHSEEMKNDIAEIFESLKDEKYILLACTHYPVIEKQILDFIPAAILIDPVSEMAEEILKVMKDANGNSSVKWITSGNADEMKRVLNLVYAIKTEKTERIIL